MTFLITRIGPQTIVSEQDISYCKVLPLSDGYINVWVELNDIDFNFYVYQQRFDANGNALSSKTVIQNRDITIGRYDTALLANGHYVLIWRSAGEIHQQIFDLNGNPKTADILVEDSRDDSSISIIAVTAFPDGKYSITWEWDDTSDFTADKIYHRIFDADGGAVRTDILEGDTFFRPAILAFADGGYVVARQSIGPNALDRSILLRVYDAVGNAGEDLIIDQNPWYDPELTTTALASGKYVLTWLSDRNRDGTQEIYQRLFTADGEFLGAEILVKDTTLGIRGSPEVTALNNGGYVVVWERYGGQGGVFKRQYDADGLATEPETLVSAPGDNLAGKPEVTSLANGTYIVTWVGRDGAYSQSFDINGNRIGHAILISDQWSSSSFSITPTALPDGSHVVTWEIYGSISQHFFDNTALPSLTPGREWALGTEGNDLLSIAPQTLTAGDILEALGGLDTLQLETGGYLDLRAAAKVSGFEVLIGSSGDDVIATDVSRIASFSTFDLGSGFDVFRLMVEGHCDLRGLPPLKGVEELQVQGSNLDDSIVADVKFGSVLALDLGSGTDRLELGAAGTYNLQGVRNVEEIKGTIRNDVLVLDQNVLSAVVAIDLDRGSDALELAGGGTFRLSPSHLKGIETIVVSNGFTTKVIGTGLPDVVVGGSGQDHVVGGAGKDQLSSEGGDDRVDGGSDGDRLTGGNGKDAFVFTSRPGLSNVDTITDFNVRDDSIWLDNAVFRNVGKGTLAKPMKLKPDAFVIGKEAKDAEDRIIYNKAAGKLSYDPDGSGSANAIKFAQIKKGLSLKSTDFFVI
ncbi:calcium-binding protein [Microvirga sp. CF3016]|uniref:calcium-binding protein n=1 Tax=Microvirga sp. CF3016 TaxID=3110181 RepID=UPI002E75E587|nr:calcium-binding protein [Microvirga sp. CF3016]MEE1613054.1 calcium-binding protein [Microvirga sp. CF3016]